MPLDPKQHAKAEAWMNKFLKGKPCPVCARSSWLVHNAINGMPDITEGALPTAGHVTMYGVILYRCGHCNYVVPVAAHPIGIDVGGKA